jgi:hypothetical protein
MLYLCALDAQSHGRKDLGFDVLRKIVREYDEEWMTEEAKTELRLPVLLRWTPAAITSDLDVSFDLLMLK